MNPNYIPSLDGVRALSVFIVLASHAGLGNIIPGGFGVTTFFFLSGFLITTLLLKEFNTNRKIDYKLFYARRILRLTPPLLITIVIGNLLCLAGLIKGNVTFEGVLAQIFYMANYYQIFDWGPKPPEGMGILWSLAVEEHFYIFFPILISICLRFLTKNKTICVLSLLCVAVLAWRIVLIVVLKEDQIRTYYATDTRIDSILFGCILAMFYNPINNRKYKLPKATTTVFILFSILLLTVSFLLKNNYFRETIRYSIQGIALMPLFYLAINYHDNIFIKWLNWAWIRKIGVYSYFIYLAHAIILAALRTTIKNISTLELVLLSSLLSVFIAYLLDKYIDIHFKKLRSQLQPHPK